MIDRGPLYAVLAGVPLDTAATRLGLRAGDRGSWGPCPVCGAERRGSTDRRGPLGPSRDRGGWRCHACGAGGDVAALVRARAGGGSGADGWARARELAEAVGLVAPGGAVARDSGPGVVVPRPVAPPAPVAALEAPLRAAPADEVAAVWGAGWRVTSDAEVSAWLRSRALDPEAVAALDVARAYPTPDDLAHAVAEREGMRLASGLDPIRGATMAGAVPWAAFGSRRWCEGWRLVMPTWSARGVMVGVRARWVRPDPTRPKEGGGTGLDAGPAVYADPVGRWLLERGPDARAGDVAAAGWRWSGAVVIAEGGPDFLTLATAPARLTPGREATAAILGVWSGAWSAAVGSRVPPGCTVRLTVHDDDAGRAYAARIRTTIPATCRLEVVT